MPMNYKNNPFINLDIGCFSNSSDFLVQMAGNEERGTMLAVLQIPMCSLNWKVSRPLREERIRSSLRVG